MSPPLGFERLCRRPWTSSQQATPQREPDWLAMRRASSTSLGETPKRGRGIEYVGLPKGFSQSDLGTPPPKRQGGLDRKDSTQSQIDAVAQSQDSKLKIAQKNSPKNQRRQRLPATQIEQRLAAAQRKQAWQQPKGNEAWHLPKASKGWQQPEGIQGWQPEGNEAWHPKGSKGWQQPKGKCGERGG